MSKRISDHNPLFCWSKKRKTDVSLSCSLIRASNTIHCDSRSTSRCGAPSDLRCSSCFFFLWSSPLKTLKVKVIVCIPSTMLIVYMYMFAGGCRGGFQHRWAFAGRGSAGHGGLLRRGGGSQHLQSGACMMKRTFWGGGAWEASGARVGEHFYDVTPSTSRG